MDSSQPVIFGLRIDLNLKNNNVPPKINQEIILDKLSNPLEIRTKMFACSLTKRSRVALCMHLVSWQMIPTIFLGRLKLVILFQKERFLDGYHWKPMNIYALKNNDEIQTLKVELRWPTDIPQYMAIGELSIFYRSQDGSKSKDYIIKLHDLLLSMPNDLSKCIR